MSTGSDAVLGAAVELLQQLEKLQRKQGGWDYYINHLNLGPLLDAVSSMRTDEVDAPIVDFECVECFRSESLYWPASWTCYDCGGYIRMASK